jgi:tetratricopeptide (TPR) repeat protein
MALLSDFCMPRLLREWAQERSTGTLTVSAAPPADVVATVLVENGAVVFATRRAKRDPTGELFLEIFQVPDMTSDNADEIERIERQIVRVIGDLFNWPIAEVAYSDGISLSHWPRLETPVPDLMLQGMRNVSDVERVRAWVGDLDGTYVRSTDPFSLFNLPLEPDEAFLLSRFDEPHRLADLLAVSGLEEDRTLRLVAAFQFAGAIERTASSANAAKRPAGRSEGAHPVEPVDIAEAATFWYMIEEKMRAVDEGVDYYALLGVERRASTDAIVEQYRELARTFHPDRYRHFAPNHIDMDSRLDAIFGAMTTAYSVLTNPLHRNLYDRELARLEQKRAVRVTGPLPDRAQTGAIPLRTVSVPIPSLPVEPPKPVEAPKPVEVPSPSPAPAAERGFSGSLSAVDLFKHGQNFAAAGDHARAVQAFERAVQLAPDNVWLSIALGSSLAFIPGMAHRAEATLRKAITLAPFASRPYVALAQLYRRVGRFDDARVQIQQAFDIKPGDKLVLDEVAELDKVDKNGRGGILRKILGTT